jgi:hypothetical protein
VRDKNNLSHAEAPVFMRVLRNHVRDEGFFSKPARVAAVGVYRFTILHLISRELFP